MIKEMLGFKPSDPDEEVLAKWKTLASHVSKPCWKLKYCPYGSLVEEFPLLPETLKEAEEHNEYIKRCLGTGILGDQKKLDETRRRMFEKEVAEFDPKDYPPKMPKEIGKAQCEVFGHICPVFFVAEGLAETPRRRVPAHRLKKKISSSLT